MALRARAAKSGARIVLWTSLSVVQSTLREDGRRRVADNCRRAAQALDKKRHTGAREGQVGAVDKSHTVGRGVKVNSAAAESGVLNIREAGGSGSRTGAPQYDSAPVVFNLQNGSFKYGRET